MDVKLEAWTPEPVSVISRAAGTSYGKHDASQKRIESCVVRGHDSVLEHASVTFHVTGISRACSHQLVRHRMASFVQESQRYVRQSFEGYWYVIPPEITANKDAFEAFKVAMGASEMRYSDALEIGIKPEDARYLLPEAAKTNITVTMNYRELFHFFDLRLDSHAQWEIRNLAKNMYYACMNCPDREVQDMMTMYIEHHVKE